MRYKQRFPKNGGERPLRDLTLPGDIRHLQDPQSRAAVFGAEFLQNNRVARFSDFSYCRYSSPVAVLNSLLFVSLGLLQVADGFLTYIGLSLFDLGEVNPILNYCAAQVGLGCSITLIKFAILAILSLLFINRRQTRNCLGTLTLIAAVSFYTWVVNNNAVLVISS